MECPLCAEPLVVFRVPETLSAYAEADRAGICAGCLAVTAIAAIESDHADVDVDVDDVDADRSPTFDQLGTWFPEGESGIALALLLGKLDRLALNGSAVTALTAAAESSGADVFLTLDRLIADPDVTPHFDLSRRRDQLESWIE
ncbi:MAG: DUF6276 family protein [Halobacteriota archaeon]